MKHLEALMSIAIDAAREAGSSDEIPVGALVLARDGTVLATGANERERGNDPTAHAEIVALRAAASALKNWRLDGCTLVVTLEPCVMCAGAAMQARVDRIVFGAWDTKAGALGGALDVVRDYGLPHRIEIVSGVLADQCGAMLSEFFEARRTRS